MQGRGCLDQEGEPFKAKYQPRPEACEKRQAQAGPPRKKIVLESYPQLDEEEEKFKPRLVHRKRKLLDQAGPQVGVDLFLEFSLRSTWL